MKQIASIKNIRKFNVKFQFFCLTGCRNVGIFMANSPLVTTGDRIAHLGFSTFISEPKNAGKAVMAVNSKLDSVLTFGEAFV
jgi:hypothetical protein